MKLEKIPLRHTCISQNKLLSFRVTIEIRGMLLFAYQEIERNEFEWKRYSSVIT